LRWWSTGCRKTRSGKILRATMVKIAGDGARQDDPAIQDAGHDRRSGDPSFEP
jgi:hypothetical protein